MNNPPQTTHKNPGPKAQRGFSLWELAVLLGLVGLGLVAGFVFLKAGENSQRETERTNLLAAADRAIMGFIAEQGRLPCPDTDGSGVENCTGLTQKGWLPTITLGLDASAPARGVKLLRYVAYRNATLDLATLTDRFSPSHWDNYSSTPSASFFTYTTPQLSVLDFCQGLNLATAATTSSSNAHVLDAAGGTLNVAYALADGGQDRDGDGNAFDGALNFLAATPGLESPARAADSAYDDRVLARSFYNLGNALSCQQATRSLDAMAQAVEVVNEVTDQKSSNRDAAIIMTATDVVLTAITANAVINAATALTAASVAVGIVSTALGVETALCLIPIIGIPACIKAVADTVALASAVTGVTLAAVAVGLTAVAFGLEVTASIQAGIVAGKANAAAASSPGSLADTVAQLLSAYNAAVSKAATDLAKANADRIAADAALVDYTNSRTNLFTVAHVHDTAGANDAALNVALQKYLDYTVALSAYKAAQGAADSKRNQANAAAAAATAAATAASVAAAISPSTPANIIAVTQAAADAAAAAATAAKDAMDLDPTNSTLTNAYTAASMAAVNAAIDATNAKTDAVHYVANKQVFAAQQLATSVDRANQATELEDTATTMLAAKDQLLADYDTAVTSAANAAVYNYTVMENFCTFGDVTWGEVLEYINYDACSTQLLMYGSTLSQSPVAYSDRQAVSDALGSAIYYYDISITKESQAVSSLATSDASAQNVIAALAAYNSLNAMVAGGTGTAPGIVVTSGADAILQAADLKGAVK